MERINFQEVEDFIKELFKEKIPQHLTYHNIIHTEYVVSQAQVIGQNSSLSEVEMDVVIAAAWFHDCGFAVSSSNHEEESKKIARQYLSSKEIPDEITDGVMKCIDATKMPQDPGDDTMAQVLCDADMSYLSEDFYIDRTQLLRKEWNNTSDKNISKRSYYKDTIEMFDWHQYHTDFAKNTFSPGKAVNYKLLHKMLEKENKADKDTKKLKSENKKLTDKLRKEKLPGRGVESMFRLTARNQINLSSIADNKANILISVNSIVLTVLLTVGVGKIADYPNFTIPAILFIATSLITVIFAILSTRPKISSGKFTEEDIHNQKVNLLFFGNFYRMEYDDYEWAVKEMMKDDNHLYTNMIKDQYSLGKVIGQKYRLLRVAYTVFMFGLILSTIVFALVLMIFPL